MRILLIIIVCLAFTMPAEADVYIKSKTMAGDSETWTSGNKQRVDLIIPMLGKRTTITRIDKGIEWQIDAQRGIYEEKQIAYPITKEEPISEKEKSEMDANFDKNYPSTQPASRMGTLQTRPQTREFLGAPATGYGWEPDDSHSTFWVLPLKGDFAKAEKENEEFQKAHLEALYANTPAKEREETVKGLLNLGVNMGKSFLAFSNMKDFPAGLGVGMETMVGSSESDQPRSTMIFEMTELNLDRLDGSIFELPQGLRQVNDLAEEQARLMMGPGYDATMQSMQQIPQASTEEETAAAMGQTMDNVLETLQQAQGAIQEAQSQEETSE